MSQFSRGPEVLWVSEHGWTSRWRQCFTICCTCPSINWSVTAWWSQVNTMFSAKVAIQFWGHHTGPHSWKSQTDRWQGTTLSEFITHSATSCRHYWQISLQENLSDRAVPGGHKANIDQRGFPPRGLRQFTRLLVVLTATNAFSWIPQIVVAGDQRATNPQLKIFQWVQAFAEMSLDSRTTHSCLWGRRSMSDKNGCLDQSTMHIPAT